MSYVMFLVAEILGAIILYLTHRGVFDLVTAFFTVVIMLGLSYHVMVRKPDGTSIRMACFTAALWLASLFFANLFLEFRSTLITLGAALLFIATTIAAGFSTYALIQRPTDVDLAE